MWGTTISKSEGRLNSSNKPGSYWDNSDMASSYDSRNFEQTSASRYNEGGSNIQPEGIEVTLCRGNIDEPWGFVLEGNYDQSSPLIIQKVLPQSAAEKEQLMRGDVIIAVDGRDVSYLSHEEVLELINLAETELSLMISSQSDQPIPTEKPTPTRGRSRPTDYSYKDHGQTPVPYWSTTAQSSSKSSSSFRQGGSDVGSRSKSAGPFGPRAHSDGRQLNANQSFGNTNAAGISEPGWMPKALAESSRAQSHTALTERRWTPRPKPTSAKTTTYPSMTEMGWSPKAKSSSSVAPVASTGNAAFLTVGRSPKSMAGLSVSSSDVSAGQNFNVPEKQYYGSEQYDNETQSNWQDKSKQRTAWDQTNCRDEEGMPAWYGSLRPSRNNPQSSAASQNWSGHGLNKETEWVQLQTAANDWRALPNASFRGKQWFGNDYKQQRNANNENTNQVKREFLPDSNETHKDDMQGRQIFMKEFTQDPNLNNKEFSQETNGNQPYAACWTSKPKKQQTRDGSGRERFRSEIQNIHLVTATWTTSRGSQNDASSTNQWQMSSLGRYEGNMQPSERQNVGKQWQTDKQRQEESLKSLQQRDVPETVPTHNLDTQVIKQQPKFENANNKPIEAQNNLIGQPDNENIYPVNPAMQMEDKVRYTTDQELVNPVMTQERELKQPLESAEMLAVNEGEVVPHQITNGQSERLSTEVELKQNETSSLRDNDNDTNASKISASVDEPIKEPVGQVATQQNTQLSQDNKIQTNQVVQAQLEKEQPVEIVGKIVDQSSPTDVNKLKNTTSISAEVKAVEIEENIVTPVTDVNSLSKEITDVQKSDTTVEIKENVPLEHLQKETVKSDKVCSLPEKTQQGKDAIENKISDNPCQQNVEHGIEGKQTTVGLKEQEPDKKTAQEDVKTHNIKPEKEKFEKQSTEQQTLVEANIVQEKSIDVVEASTKPCNNSDQIQGEGTAVETNIQSRSETSKPLSTSEESKGQQNNSTIMQGNTISDSNSNITSSKKKEKDQSELMIKQQEMQGTETMVKTTKKKKVPTTTLH